MNIDWCVCMWNAIIGVMLFKIFFLKRWSKYGKMLTLGKFRRWVYKYSFFYFSLINIKDLTTLWNQEYFLIFVITRIEICIGFYSFCSMLDSLLLPNSMREKLSLFINEEAETQGCYVFAHLVRNW